MMPTIMTITLFKTRDGRWRARLDAQGVRKCSEPANSPVEATTRALVLTASALKGVPDVERERASLGEP